MMGSEIVSTAVGTKVLFENNRIRVWEMSLTSGQSSDMHKHLHDHVIIYGMPSTVRGVEQGATTSISQDVDAGFVLYRTVGKDGLKPHRLVNIGHGTSVHYIVEILGESASTVTQPYENNGRGRFGEAESLP